ncbi:hypothetical protein T439DRAFT_321890 [Meredithblackwellia eburnea MCA 4105]
MLTLKITALTILSLATTSCSAPLPLPLLRAPSISPQLGPQQDLKQQQEKRFVAPPPHFAPRNVNQGAEELKINLAARKILSDHSQQAKARRAVRRDRDSPSKRSPAPADDEQAHHNIYIDASGAEDSGAGGGIHNSTINVNIINNVEKSKDEKRATSVGENSVLLDLSEDSDGIEDSTVHVNILPARSPSPEPAPADSVIGDHSILINSSGTLDSDSDDNLTAGDHSAVVSSSIDSSTINLTVVSSKEGGDESAREKRDSASRTPLEKKDLGEWEDQVQKIRLERAAEESVEPVKWIRVVQKNPSPAEEQKRALHASHMWSKVAMD